jgi:predicted component of type VI protein secretion system
VREMTLTLTVQNTEKSAEGFPASVTVDKGNLDIGRSIHVDLTLPDPTHFIAGIHCEVQYRDGVYWLNDVSPHTTVVINQFISMSTFC